MHIRQLTIHCLVALSLLGGFSAASAAPSPAMKLVAPARFVYQSKASSAAEAARIAKQRYGGKILSVSEQKTDSGKRYRVKLLLDNGRVKTVVIQGQ